MSINTSVCFRCLMEPAMLDSIGARRHRETIKIENTRRQTSYNCSVRCLTQTYIVLLTRGGVHLYHIVRDYSTRARAQRVCNKRK